VDMENWYVFLMHACWKSVFVQRHACNSLQKLAWAFNDGFQERLYWAGGIRAIINAASLEPGSTDLQVSCLPLLEDSIRFNRRTAHVSGTLGGIDAVARALRTFPRSRNIQKLTSALSSHCDFSPDNMERVLSVGGIQLIARAMKLHYWDPEVMFRAGRGISSPTRNWKVANMVVKYIGFDFLVQAMRDHMRSYRVGQEIMQATRNIQLIGQTFRQGFVDAGLLDMIVPTMQAEINERGTQAIGSTNIAILAYWNTTHRQMLGEAGAVEMVLDGMTRWKDQHNGWLGELTFSDIWPVVQAGTQALWALTLDNTANQHAFTEAGGIEILANSIRSRPHDLFVKSYGCSTLASIVANNVSFQGSVLRLGVSLCPIPLEQWLYLGPEVLQQLGRN